MKKFITFVKSDDNILPYEEPHREIAYRAASEGIVLLENDGTLPLKPGKIALYGAGASHTIKGGTGSGEVNERHSVNALEGLETAGFEITTKKWIKDYQLEYETGLRDVEEEIKSAMRKLDLKTYMSLFLKSYLYPFGRDITKHDVEKSSTDTCIYIVARQSGEGAERKLENNDFQLSEQEKKNIRFCTEHYEKTIVVLNIGSSFDCRFMDEIPGINALVYMCQLGTAGGNALADVLCGRVTPSGKLTDTWVNAYEDIPYGNSYSYLNGNLENEDYLEDIFVGYRYYDTFHREVRYPFGYGKSYTDFDIHYDSISKDTENINITATITNTGAVYSGKEIVQVYVSCPQGKLKKEYQRLAAFAKTSLLAPGESETLSLSFPLSYIASYDGTSASYLLEAGNYLIRIGKHSQDTAVCATLNIPEEICYSRHHSICPVQAPLPVLTLSDENAKTLQPEITDSTLDTLTILPADVATTTYRYQKNPVCPNDVIKEQLKALTVLECIDLVVGAGLKDMLMNESFIKVPGVAGNTTST